MSGRILDFSSASPMRRISFSSSSPDAQPMINTELRAAARPTTAQRIQSYVYPIFGIGEGKADEHEFKKYKPPKAIQPDENINALSQKIGNSKGKKTNIEIKNEKPKKERQRKMKNGDFTSEQKWRIYKTKVEPELINQIVQSEPNQIEQSIKNAFKEFHIPNMQNIVNEANKDNADLDNKEVLHAKEVLYNDIVNVPVQSTNNEKQLPANFGHMAETDVEKIIRDRKLEGRVRQREERIRAREEKFKAKEERQIIAELNKASKIELKEYNRDLAIRAKEAREKADRARFEEIEAKKEAERRRLEEASQKQKEIVDNYNKVLAQRKIGSALLTNRAMANYKEMKEKEKPKKTTKKSPTKFGIRGRPPTEVKEKLGDLAKDYLNKTGSPMSPSDLRQARAALSVKHKGPG